MAVDRRVPVKAPIEHGGEYTRRLNVVVARKDMANFIRILTMYAVKREACKAVLYYAWTASRK